MSKLVAAILVVASLATVVQSATTDFSADNDITVSAVTGNGVTTDLLILSGSQAESWSYDEGIFTVTNPATFRVGSSNASALSLRVFSGGSEVACGNNTNPGSSQVELPVASGIYTIYPYSTNCVVASPSSGGSRPRIVASLPVSVTLFLTRTLSSGARGVDVKSLQQFLNRNGFVVAISGLGSPGEETEFFGPATRAAVIKFQLAGGIINSANDLAAGLVGPATLARINLITDLQSQLARLVEQLNQLKLKK